MSSYGPFFDFRVTPEPHMRQGRYILDPDTLADVVPIGGPVIVTADEPSTLFTGARIVDLATTAQEPPLPGQGGIAVYEWIDLNGLDPVINSHSDRPDVPPGKLIQVVRGEGIKVVFRNVADHTYLHTRDYPGRTMVAGVGIATPTVTEGDLLTPGVGTEDDGFWAVTTDPTEAWLVVELVDNDRGEVEARLMF